jgi:hypothetical protein
MIQTTNMASPPRPLENVLDLNNHAVSYLCQGNHSATTSTLRAAIESLEKCFQQDKSQPCCPPCAEPPTKKRRRSVTGGAVNTDTDTDAATVAVSSTPGTVKQQQGGYVAIRSITVSDSSSSSTTADVPASSLNDDTSLLMVYDRAFGFPSIADDNEENESHRSPIYLTFLAWKISPSPSTHSISWVSNICRTHRRNFPPLYHSESSSQSVVSVSQGGHL